MPLSSLKVPTDLRDVIRRLHPELKRKVRAALTDILDDPSCGKALKEDLRGIGVCEWEEVESSIESAMVSSRSLPSVLEPVSMKRQHE